MSTHRVRAKLGEMVLQQPCLSLIFYLGIFSDLVVSGDACSLETITNLGTWNLGLSAVPVKPFESFDSRVTAIKTRLCIQLSQLDETIRSAIILQTLNTSPGSPSRASCHGRYFKVELCRIEDLRVAVRYHY